MPSRYFRHRESGRWRFARDRTQVKTLRDDPQWVDVTPQWLRDEQAPPPRRPQPPLGHEVANDYVRGLYRPPPPAPIVKALWWFPPPPPPLVKALWWTPPPPIVKALWWTPAPLPTPRPVPEPRVPITAPPTTRAERRALTRTLLMTAESSHQRNLADITEQRFTHWLRQAFPPEEIDEVEVLGRLGRR